MNTYARGVLGVYIHASTLLIVDDMGNLVLITNEHLQQMMVYVYDQLYF